MFSKRRKQQVQRPGGKRKLKTKQQRMPSFRGTKEYKREQADGKKEEVQESVIMPAFRTEQATMS